MKKFEETLSKMEGDLSGVLKYLVTFVKEHKKLLVVLGVGYVIYRYLFEEE